MKITCLIIALGLASSSVFAETATTTNRPTGPIAGLVGSLWQTSTTIIAAPIAGVAPAVRNAGGAVSDTVEAPVTVVNGTILQ